MFVETCARKETMQPASLFPFCIEGSGKARTMPRAGGGGGGVTRGAAAQDFVDTGAWAIKGPPHSVPPQRTGTMPDPCGTHQFPSQASSRSEAVPAVVDARKAPATAKHACRKPVLLLAGSFRAAAIKSRRGLHNAASLAFSGSASLPFDLVHVWGGGKLNIARWESSTNGLALRAPIVSWAQLGQVWAWFDQHWARFHT